MKTTTAMPAFRFSRPVEGGPVNILNQHSYLMGTYNQGTGLASWHRVVSATEKASVERSLAATFPMKAS